MMKKMLFLLAGLLIIPESSYAEVSNQCFEELKTELEQCRKLMKKKPKKKRVRRKKRRKKVRKPKVVVGPQGLQGLKGDQGEKGDPGPPGRDGYTYIYKTNTVYHTREVVRSGLTLGVGYMSIGLWPDREYAYANGPSLRLTGELSDRKDLMVEVGFAPERYGGIMGRIVVTHWFENINWLGVGGGMFGQTIGLASDVENGFYVGLNPEVSVRSNIGKFMIRAGVGPSVGITKFYDSNDGWNAVGGVVGSAGISYKW